MCSDLSILSKYLQTIFLLKTCSELQKEYEELYKDYNETSDSNNDTYPNYYYEETTETTIITTETTIAMINTDSPNYLDQGNLLKGIE